MVQPTQPRVSLNIKAVNGQGWRSQRIKKKPEILLRQKEEDSSIPALKDAKMAKQLCEQYKADCSISHLKTKKKATNPPVSIENGEDSMENYARPTSDIAWDKLFYPYLLFADP